MGKENLKREREKKSLPDDVCQCLLKIANLHRKKRLLELTNKTHWGGKVSSPKEEQKTLQGLNVGFKKRKSSVECSL